MFTPVVFAVSAAPVPASDGGWYQLVGLVMTCVLIGALVAGVVSHCELRLNLESVLYCALPGPEGETCTRFDGHAGLHRNAYYETSWQVEYLSCMKCGSGLFLGAAAVTCRGCGLSLSSARVVLEAGESLVADYDGAVLVAVPISVD